MLFQRRQLPILTSSGRLLHLIGLGAFLILVFGPILSLVADLFHALFQSSFSGVSLFLPTGRRLHLLIQSLFFASGVAGGATLLGILTGSALWRWRTPGGIYLRWFFVLLFTIPPYIHAMAWMSLTEEIGLLARAWEIRVFLPRGWFAAWWVEVMALMPLGTGMTLLGLESVSPSLLEAARLMRSETDVLLGVALPLARPLILAGAGFIFLFSLADYTVPSLYQVNTYALEIFAEYSATSEASRAFLLSLPLLGVTILALVFSQSRLRQAALKPLRQVRPWPVAPEVSGWLAWGQGLALFLLAAQVLVPLLGLGLSLETGDTLIQTITSGLGETGFTAWICLLAAMLSLPPALALARKLSAPPLSSRFWWFLTTAPLALPAPLVGIGLISLWNRDLTHGVYGSSIMPILAVLSRFTPLAAVLLSAQLRRIDPLLLDAARIYHRNPFRTWAAIYIPMITPGLLAAACVTFALSAGELGATLLVIPPGRSTLTLRIYNYLHYGASERVAGLCLVMILGALSAGILSALAMHGWRRRLPIGPTILKRRT